MVKLGITNTRMKDFFDVWFLTRRFEFDGTTLHQAIHATLARRQTIIGDQLPHPLTGGFGKDATKQTQWTAFIRRNGLTGAPLNFEEVIEAIREFVAPVLRKDGIASRWKPGKGWRNEHAS